MALAAVAAHHQMDWERVLSLPAERLDFTLDVLVRMQRDEKDRLDYLALKTAASVWGKG